MVTTLLNKLLKRRPSAQAEGASIDQMLQSVVERRVHPRFEVRDMTRMRAADRPFSTVILDVSRSGARIATRMPWDAGRVVGLEIVVDGTTLVLPLRILWDRWSGGHYENGGVFVDLTEEEASHLARYVDDVRDRLSAETMHLDASDLLVAKIMENVPQPVGA